jgi:two-component system cell cycle response regulator
MPLRNKTSERGTRGKSSLVPTVRGESIQAILDVEATGRPCDLLEVATRELTALLGETGACTSLGARPPSMAVFHDANLAGPLPETNESAAVATASLGGGGLISVGDGTSIAVPLSDGDHCLGVVLVRSKRPRLVTEEERATAVLVARLTAALLTRTAEWQARPAAPVEPAKTASLPRAPEILSGDGRRVLLVEDDAATAAALVEALEDEGYVVLRASDGREGVARALSSNPDVILFDVNLPFLDGFAAADLVRAAEITRDTPIIFLSARSDLCQQVRARQLDNVDFLPKPLSGNELLTRINQAIIGARARYELQQQAVIDELTGLGNLRMFRARLHQEHERFSRYGSPLSLAMIDVDKLKTINDLKGHVAGSDALRAIADVLRSQARTTDLVARYGGDEMVVLLPHTTLGDAVHFAERVRSAVARLTVHGLHPTVSVGVASLNAKCDETDDELLKRADSAAYAAKRAGGNRTSADGGPCRGE